MNPYLNNGRIISPITTGNVGLNRENTQTRKTEAQQGDSFADILRRQINSNAKVEFSKHAVERVVKRNIDVSSDKMERLNVGVKLAEEKGLSNPLILVGSTAFVVNVPNNKVITTLSGDDLKGNVFTNIDGTVII